MPPKAKVFQYASPVAYEHELESLRDGLTVLETEETWDTISRNVTTLVALLELNAANYPHESVTALRSYSRSINSAAFSERSRLSGAAVELMGTAAKSLERAFDPLIPLYLPTLLTLCSRSNKVFVNRARKGLLEVIEHTRSPSIIPFLAESTKDKSVSLRLAAADSILTCLNLFNPPDLEKEPRAREIEAVIRATATDANADVRRTGKKLFEAYKQIMPARVDSFTNPLTPIIKKYLNIKVQAPAPPVKLQPPTRPPSAQSLNATQERSAKPYLSSSTSSSHSANTAREHNFRPPTAQGRPVSSHQVEMPPRAQSTEPHPRRQDTLAHRPARRPLDRHAGNKGEMAPPPFVPKRPMQQASESATVSLSDAPHSEADFHLTQLQRPPSSQSRPFASGDTNRPLSVQEAQSRQTTGPMRPAAGTSRPQPARDGGAAERKGRVVGGARRVPLMPQSQPETTLTSSTIAEPRRAGATLEKAMNSGAEATRGKHTQPDTNSVKPRSGISRSDVPDAEKMKQNTARSEGKSTGEVHAKRERPAEARNVQKSTKAAGSRGATAPNVTARKTAAKARLAAATSRKQVHPTEVPLPPSPKPEPATVPLPPSRSPTPQPQRQPPQPETGSRPQTPASSPEENHDDLPRAPSESAEDGQRISEVKEEPVEVQHDVSDVSVDPPSVSPVAERTPRAFPSLRLEDPYDPSTPRRARPVFPTAVEQTPISALAADIQRGFLFSPGPMPQPSEPFNVNLPLCAPLKPLRKGSRPQTRTLKAFQPDFDSVPEDRRQILEELPLNQ